EDPQLCPHHSNPNRASRHCLSRPPALSSWSQTDTGSNYFPSPTTPRNSALSGITPLGLNCRIILAWSLSGATTKQAAGRLFRMVDQAAADANLTIDASKPGQAALEILQNKQAGGQMTQGIYQFLKRATSPGSQPVTYPEARSFFSNLSSLSMNESQRLAPNTQRLLGNFVSALDDSIRDAVGQIGQGDNYAQAMRQYAA